MFRAVVLVASCLASVAAFAPNFITHRASSHGRVGVRMALAYGDKTGQLSLESKGNPDDKTGVLRDYVVEPNTAWRFGLPDYSRVNKAYYEGRSKIHAEDSIEALVQRVVKNWEVESHHISDVSQWKTMETSTFKAFTNGLGPVSAEEMKNVGPYNMLLGEMPSCPYHASKETFESANKIFTEAFTQGFAWEGEMIEMHGHCLARLNDKLQITELQLHFDREDFQAKLNAGRAPAT